ncbi:hypothetical protein F4810DRAFT_296993 [Camillea tinctor]|nr:hypothetical protein F4810DRAFT_296993 [Camillea tinctor]
MGSRGPQAAVSIPYPPTLVHTRQMLTRVLPQKYPRIDQPWPPRHPIQCRHDTSKVRISYGSNPALTPFMISIVSSLPYQRRRCHISPLTHRQGRGETGSIPITVYGYIAGVWILLLWFLGVFSCVWLARQGGQLGYSRGYFGTNTSFLPFKDED